MDCALPESSFSSEHAGVLGVHVEKQLTQALQQFKRDTSAAQRAGAAETTIFRSIDLPLHDELLVLEVVFEGVCTLEERPQRLVLASSPAEALAQDEGAAHKCRGGAAPDQPIMHGSATEQEAQSLHKNTLATAALTGDHVEIRGKVHLAWAQSRASHSSATAKFSTSRDRSHVCCEPAVSVDVAAPSSPVSQDCLLDEEATLDLPSAPSAARSKRGLGMPATKGRICVHIPLRSSRGGGQVRPGSRSCCGCPLGQKRWGRLLHLVVSCRRGMLAREADAACSEDRGRTPGLIWYALRMVPTLPPSRPESRMARRVVGTGDPVCRFCPRGWLGASGRPGSVDSCCRGGPCGDHRPPPGVTRLLPSPGASAQVGAGWPRCKLEVARSDQPPRAAAVALVPAPPRRRRRHPPPFVLERRPGARPRTPDDDEDGGSTCGRSCGAALSSSLPTGPDHRSAALRPAASARGASGVPMAARHVVGHAPPSG
eukprot:scaffold947_cov375-Prasinococcus_capsulatus_cf.AAC.6